MARKSRYDVNELIRLRDAGHSLTQIASMLDPPTSRQNVSQILARNETNGATNPTPQRKEWIYCPHCNEPTTLAYLEGPGDGDCRNCGRAFTYGETKPPKGIWPTNERKAHLDMKPKRKLPVSASRDVSPPTQGAPAPASPQRNESEPVFKPNRPAGWKPEHRRREDLLLRRIEALEKLTQTFVQVDTDLVERSMVAMDPLLERIEKLETWMSSNGPVQNDWNDNITTRIEALESRITGDDLAFNIMADRLSALEAGNNNLGEQILVDRDTIRSLWAAIAELKRPRCCDTPMRVATRFEDGRVKYRCRRTACQKYRTVK